jgi:protein-serine/threonine kinase
MAVEPDAPATRAGTLQPGDVIDGFRLEECLHRGGMAHLWRITHPAHALPLVMKLPRIRGGEDPATIVGFEVEQMILPTLVGPHVPKFIAKGDFTRVPYLVMEHIAGPTLRPRLDDAPLSPDKVADIGARVALALHDLHRQRVVHLDVKPSNILFRADGTAVLIDFGLSHHDHLPDLLDEEFRLPMGTGPYMSPEQLHFVRNDPRSDLFALGVVLYQLSTGERPFGQPNSVTGLRRRLYVDPAPPRALRSELPPWLQEAILHCLEVHPEQRYQSAAQLAADLRNPSQIALGPRAQRLHISGWVKRARRWFDAWGHEPRELASAEEQLARSPTVLAAIDVRNATPELLEQLRSNVLHIMRTAPGARLACLSVMKTALIGMDELTDRDGQSLHVKQLVELKHWAHPLTQVLQADDGRVTFHVLEAPDPARAILDFAERTQVDHIVMGARGSSALRRYLGSVSAQVAAEADCTVTVVRAPAA